MNDQADEATTAASRVATPTRSRRPLGWGTSMAVVGLVIFAVGLVFMTLGEIAGRYGMGVIGPVPEGYV